MFNECKTNVKPIKTNQAMKKEVLNEAEKQLLTDAYTSEKVRTYILRSLHECGEDSEEYESMKNNQLFFALMTAMEVSGEYSTPECLVDYNDACKLISSNAWGVFESLLDYRHSKRRKSLSASNIVFDIPEFVYPLILKACDYGNAC